MKKILILIMVLVFASSVYADYNETGNYNNYFQNEIGFFNSELTDFDLFTRSISAQRQTPLISDLDGDGINEIIILDDDIFRLYQNKELDIVDSFNLPSSERFSNFITFDIDNDGFREIIIILEQSEELYIIEYNGTSFHNQSIISLSGLTHITGEFMIKCESVNKCLMVYSEDMDNAPIDSDRLFMAFFNSTDVTHETFLKTSNNPFSVFCFPKIRTMAIADYDGDSNLEFIFSVADADRSGVDETVEIFWINILNNNSPVLEQSTTETRPSDVVAIDVTGGNCIDSQASNILTSPLVFDIDGSPSNNLETIVGFMIDENNFKIHSYKSDGTNLDDYPEFTNGEGIIISNAFLSNVFTDTGDVDFCVMGYDITDNIIETICGSEQTSFIPETKGITFTIGNLFNVSQTYGLWNVLTHSAQHSTITTDGSNLDEFVNSYGVFSQNQDCTLGFCTMSLIFENPKGDGVLLSVDVEKIGRDDLLVLTSTNLWYIDDKFVNTPAQIDEYFINPCLDSTWSINTTSEIRITPFDFDGDLVSARAILYYNDDNEQDSGWSLNVSSGTTISFGDFKANKTISIGVLRLMARDIENPDTIDIIDLTFSVAPSGVVFGECTTLVSGIVEEEEIEVERELNETSTLRDNRMVDTIEEISNLIGIPIIIFIMLLMFGVDLVLVTALHRVPFLALTSIILFDFFLILITALMGLMGTAFLISLFAVIIIAGAFFITFSFNKITSGG